MYKYLSRARNRQEYEKIFRDLLEVEENVEVAK